MALEKGQTSLSQKEGSLYFLSLTTDNQFKPTWPAEVYTLQLVDQATKKLLVLLYSLCLWDLGRIEMINRERLSDDEIPSGDTTITRIPQYDSGFATGISM